MTAALNLGLESFFMNFHGNLGSKVAGCAVVQTPTLRSPTSCHDHCDTAAPLLRVEMISLDKKPHLDYEIPI